MSNRLTRESSPYLLQHADNPVDWYPWGTEALERARREDKPILLSIGYSACHWCHVMAHDCFEDTEVAAVMNAHFVNIKVDREERPDLDLIYQNAHQLLARRAGGWPLTVFLTPDQVPFFAGTYFPKEPRHGLPGFPDLLVQVERAYRTRRGDLLEQNRSLLEALAWQAPQGGNADAATLGQAQKDLAAAFDALWGGFSRAPKFPRPAELEFLLDGEDVEGRQRAMFTLGKMLEGGLMDHLGGGFFRYSVDERWEIPHFEKMLYDNGPLLGLLARAFRLSGDVRFRAAAEGTVGWLAREMTAPQGGFYSAQDADSEGHEGRYYVWTPDVMEGILDAPEYAVAAAHFGLDQAPNFEGRYWHLQARGPVADAALLEHARAKLFVARAQRIAPGRDEKVLTAWNGLMIAGLARAGRIFAREDWVDMACAAADFLHREVWSDGRLLAVWKDGRAKLNAYLDDHAYLLEGLLELLQARFRGADLQWAQTLAEVLLEHFEDKASGGFFFTSDDHEALIQRPKNTYDQATPSGAAVAARCLQKLGHLLGEARYLGAAARCLEDAAAAMMQAPAAHASMLCVLADELAPPRQVVLHGAACAWRPQVEARLGSRDVLFVLPAAHLPGIPAASAAAAEAQVCEGARCLPACATLDELLDVLQQVRNN